MLVIIENPRSLIKSENQRELKYFFLYIGRLCFIYHWTEELLKGKYPTLVTRVKWLQELKTVPTVRAFDVYRRLHRNVLPVFDRNLLPFKYKLICETLNYLRHGSRTSWSVVVKRRLYWQWTKRSQSNFCSTS